MEGSIHQLLASDHRRLEALLTRAARDPGSMGLEAYEEFRTGLLRHIGMEEKVLIPSAERSGGGRPAMAEKIRLDHGALAALLVPPPTPDIINVIRIILSGHNLLEEGKDGLYETCERLARNEAGRMLQNLRGFPAPRLKPNFSGPGAMDAVRRAMARAGYDWDDLVRRTSV